MSDQELEAADVWEAIRKIRIAMLTTDEGGDFVSRPMSSLAREDDGKIYFVSRLDAKVGELGEASPVNLSYSDPHTNLYVSVSGTAETSQDREKLRELWSMWVEAWLPEGPDGDDVALISVSPEHAKIWDGTSSRLLYAGKVLKAVATQRPPDGGDVAEVELGARSERQASPAAVPDASAMRRYSQVMEEATGEVGASSAAGPAN